MGPPKRRKLLLFREGTLWHLKTLEISIFSRKSTDAFGVGLGDHLLIIQVFEQQWGTMQWPLGSCSPGHWPMNCCAVGYFRGT